MDPFFLLLGGLMLPLFAGLMPTKPSDVPLNRLYANVGRLGPVAKRLYFALSAVFIIFMVLLFLGMGLQRAAE